MFNARGRGDDLRLDFLNSVICLTKISYGGVMTEHSQVSCRSIDSIDDIIRRRCNTDTSDAGSLICWCASSPHADEDLVTLDQDGLVAIISTLVLRHWGMSDGRHDGSWSRSVAHSSWYIDHTRLHTIRTIIQVIWLCTSLDQWRSTRRSLEVMSRTQCQCSEIPLRLSLSCRRLNFFSADSYFSKNSSLRLCRFDEASVQQFAVREDFLLRS